MVHSVKLLSRLIIVFVICLLAVPAVSAPVEASATINISAREGYVGDEIEISGKAFHARQTVNIYYDGELQTDARVKGSSSPCGATFTTYLTIPDSCQGYHYIDAKDERGETATTRFIVKPKICQDEYSGHVGDTVKVQGSGFPSEGTGIKLRYYLDTDSHSGLDSSPHIDFPIAQADVAGSWEQTFSVPASIKGTHSIDAYYDDDENTLIEVNNDEVRFEVQPSITLDPDSGCVGDSIAISGSGFARNESEVELKYDGSDELAVPDVDEYGNWGPISFTIPSSVQGSHLIEALQGSSTTAVLSAVLTVEPGVFLNPAAGHAGQTFNVTGAGFGPNIMVNVSYQGQSVNAITDANGDLPCITFTAQGEHSEQWVNATYGSNSAHAAIFNMEEMPPPKPHLISPINTERTGLFASFTGRICPKLQWSKVTDASGIASYDLQIADSADFSAPVVSVSIASENPSSTDDTVAYVLPKGYALSYGDYYWRVRAVDGAANEGGWSEAQSFYAGWLPRWVMIAISAGLLLLIIIVTSLSIRRRSEYYW
jgi:hypothetical protein